MVGKTLVVNSGAHGKFLSRLDLDVQRGRVVGHRYRLIPVLAQDLPEDPDMTELIQEIRSPHEMTLGEPLAISETLLYRRGNFNGTFDELILDALIRRGDAQIGFSPGFRWGITILPGQEITLEDVYAHTALPYANTWVREMTGTEIHQVMEDVPTTCSIPIRTTARGATWSGWAGSPTRSIRPGAWAGASSTSVSPDARSSRTAATRRPAGPASARPTGRRRGTSWPTTSGACGA